MFFHTGIDKMLDNLLDVSTVINYLGQKQLGWLLQIFQTQEEWEKYTPSEQFPIYQTGELRGTCDRNKLLSKLENLPTANILQDMQTKRSFHVIGIGQIESFLLI